MDEKGNEKEMEWNETRQKRKGMEVEVKKIKMKKKE